MQHVALICAPPLEMLVIAMMHFAERNFHVRIGVDSLLCLCLCVLFCFITMYFVYDLHNNNNNNNNNFETCPTSVPYAISDLSSKF